MKAGESRSAKGLRLRAATASLLALLLASCTSTSDPVLELRAAAEQEVAADAAADSKTAKLSLAAEEEKAASEAVAKADESAPADVADDKGATDEAKHETEQKAAAEDDPKATDASAPEDAAATEKAEQAIDAKRRGFLSAFFSPAKPQSAAAAIALKKQAEPAGDASAAEEDAKPLVDTEKSAKPLVKLASAESGDPEPMSAALTSMDALPGVRTGDQLFEITRKSGDGDTSDVDVYENTGGSYRVASAAGFARMGAHGLVRQRPDVDVGCLKPGLVNILHTIERHYGKKILVTSGYRSPAHNRAVHGAKHSQHMYCAAADIKVDGVSKWELARYVRALPGRGGVGTYCHTNAIHVDVGPERDWNWRCRRGG